MRPSAPKHVASHPLPLSAGYGANYSRPDRGDIEISVYCGRCKGSFAVDQEWVDRALERRKLDHDSIEDLRRLGFKVPDEPQSQIVVVGGYAYRWRGKTPLSIGDVVLLPGTYLTPSGWTGKVTALESAYQGPLRDILGLAP